MRLVSLIGRVVSTIAAVVSHSMLRPDKINAQQVYLRLGNRRIGNFRDELNERTVRQVLLSLGLAGYDAVVPARLDHTTYIFATLLKYHPNIRFLWRTPEDRALPLVWTDQAIAPRSAAYSKLISVTYDYKPGLILRPGHYAMPYGMHPSVYTVFHLHDRLETYRRQERKVRLLFVGTTNHTNEMPEVLFGKLRRGEIINRLRTSELVRVVSTLGELQEILNAGSSRGMILCPIPAVPQRDWLRFVSSSDFQLCPPGIMMPMCHNIVEAMSVGTIPVTNYPEWFFPPLQDMKNCVTFSTVDELLTKIARIAELDGQEIRAMRSEVVRYYSDHLSPGKWFEGLMKDPRPCVDVHVLDETEHHLRALAAPAEESSKNAVNGL